MARPAMEKTTQLSLRIRKNDKATILRAIALEQTDMTTFILRTAL